MQLHKDEALLMRSVIFAFLLKDRDDVLYESLQSLLHRLDDFLLLDHEEKDDSGDVESQNDDLLEDEESKKCDDDSYDDETDEDVSEENECVEVDELVSPAVLHNLPALEFSHKGETLHLEFEDVDNEDSVDVLIDDDFEFSAVALKIENNQLHLFTSLEDKESHSYSFTKLPKKWSKSFELGKTYGIETTK